MASSLGATDGVERSRGEAKLCHHGAHAPGTKRTFACY
uniref:Uncharacterized protein n=1 Tax=Arundo donax TaxID=35708 RepID=A0A0A9CC11_ARUDO